MSASSRGKMGEKRAAEALQAQGYVVTTAHLSRGAADLIAFRADGVLLVQVKVRTNGGLSRKEVQREFDELPLPAGTRCELWTYRKTGARYELDVRVMRDV